MRQTQSIYNKKFSHYLRSRKLNDDQLYLIKHYGEKDKNNKNSYKSKEESKYNFINEGKIKNKNKKYIYYSPSTNKISKSYSKKSKDVSKIKKRVNRIKK